LCGKKGAIGDVKNTSDIRQQEGLVNSFARKPGSRRDHVKLVVCLKETRGNQYREQIAKKKGKRHPKVDKKKPTRGEKKRTGGGKELHL